MHPAKVEDVTMVATELEGRTGARDSPERAKGKEDGEEMA